MEAIKRFTLGESIPVRVTLESSPSPGPQDGLDRHSDHGEDNTSKSDVMRRGSMTRLTKLIMLGPGRGCGAGHHGTVQKRNPLKATVRTPQRLPCHAVLQMLGSQGAIERALAQGIDRGGAGTQIIG